MAGTWPAGLIISLQAQAVFNTIALIAKKRAWTLNIVRSLFIDDHKRLWIGTENGVVLGYHARMGVLVSA